MTDDGDRQFEPEVILRDGATGRWRVFGEPVRILVANVLEEVRPLLRQVESTVESEGLFAAGFVAYEAAPAFDPALCVRVDGEFPLAWFGLFRQMREVEIEAESLADPLPDWQPSITDEDYCGQIAFLREQIRRGETYQVNFSYRLRAEGVSDPARFFRQVIVPADAPYAAHLDAGEWAVCCASPELFFRLDGEQLVSRPMKGTAARGLDTVGDLERGQTLRASVKNQAENVMIVDMVRNDLGRVAAPGSIRVPELYGLERHATVWQLTSTVAARSTAGLDELFAALFPAASITGAPKCRTMALIAERECSPRRIYTGTLGWLLPGRQAQFNVAIRTALIHRPTGRAEYGVGGGIVWDSEAQDERDECRVKARVLAGAPRTFELFETMLWRPETGCALFDRHLARLAGSAAYFGFRCDLPAVRDAWERCVRGLPARPHRLRMRLARSGAVDLSATVCDPETLDYAPVCLAAEAVNSRDVRLYHKTTDRSIYDAARAACLDCGDVLLFNQDGELTESTIANLAVEIGGRLYTPPVRCGLLPGVLRGCLLEQGGIEERVLTRDDLDFGNRLFLMNAVRGLRPVAFFCKKALPVFAESFTLVAFL